MNRLSRMVFGTLASVGLVSVAHSYGPGNPTSVTAVPPGFTKCADDGKVCKPPAGATTVYVVWGVGNKFATAQGTGDFTCLPKGWVKAPSAKTPADLGVDDPVPKVAKACYIQAASASPAPAAAPAPAPAPTAAPAAAPTPVAHGYGPGNPTSLTAIPAGFTKCADDGKVCKPPAGATAVYVVWGVGNKFATAQGKGDFTCTAKGWVKNPSAATPADLGVDDPVPKVAKACYIQAVGGSPAVAAPATPATPAPQHAATPNAPPAPASGSNVAAVPGCNAYKGAIYNAAAKQYSKMEQLNANYFKNTMMTTSDATTECAKQCGATGEPAPCAWFSVTKWLSTNTATGKDTVEHVCHMFNDRNLKQISTPNLPKGDNLGTPSMPARFMEARTYACRI